MFCVIVSDKFEGWLVCCLRGKNIQPRHATPLCLLIKLTSYGCVFSVNVDELRAGSSFSLTSMKDFLGNDCRTQPLGNRAVFPITHECGRQFSVVSLLKDELVLSTSNEILNL